MIADTDTSKIDRRDIYELPTLPFWSEGRAVLLGDACHVTFTFFSIYFYIYIFSPISCFLLTIKLLKKKQKAMSPEVGQGGAMAIEDAKCLADSLALASSIPEGIKLYETKRLPRTTRVAAKAKFNGKILSITNPILCWIRGYIMYYLGHKIVPGQNFIWGYKQD
jgi:2-polyprenyl-6-methoxyphenol hydroxylase-like FAD-dependent oxidoreductase